jgi:hypothetical protein
MGAVTDDRATDQFYVVDYNRIECACFDSVIGMTKSMTNMRIFDNAKAAV